jgi:hypothetical protein
LSLCDQQHGTSPQKYHHQYSKKWLRSGVVFEIEMVMIAGSFEFHVPYENCGAFVKQVLLDFEKPSSCRPVQGRVL